jgi:hypothetical protein
MNNLSHLGIFILGGIFGVVLMATLFVASLETQSEKMGYSRQKRKDERCLSDKKLTV